MFSFSLFPTAQLFLPHGTSRGHTAKDSVRLTLTELGTRERLKRKVTIELFPPYPSSLTEHDCCGGDEQNDR